MLPGVLLLNPQSWFGMDELKFISPPTKKKKKIATVESSKANTPKNNF